MKILIFHRWTGVRGGGTETNIKGIINYLQAKHEISLLTRYGNEIKNLAETFPNIKIHTVSKNLFENDHSYENPFLLYTHTAMYMVKSFFMLCFLLIFKKQRYDVISVHFATEGVVANVIRKLFRIPYVFVFEGYTEWEAMEGKKANGSMSITKYISQKCEQNHGYYPKVVYIGDSKFPFVEQEFIRKKAKEKTKEVLTLCRLEPRKNIQAVIETARIIVKDKKREDIRFTLGGTGISKKEILKLIKKYQLEKNIKYLGFVKEQDLIKTYQKAYIYFLPTLEEGFGIVFLEAMKSGCAVVSSNLSAIPEILQDSGVLIDNPNDYNAWAESIITLIDNQNIWFKKVNQGLDRAKYFMWPELIKNYEKVYLDASKKT